jgi:hypothetical protein
MHKPTKRLLLNPDTIRQLSNADMTRAAGGLPSAAISAENVCCSFDIACPTDGCGSHRGSCRMC